jgi:hypothetical protein
MAPLGEDRRLVIHKVAVHEAEINIVCRGSAPSRHASGRARSQSKFLQSVCRGRARTSLASQLGRPGGPAKMTAALPLLLHHIATSPPPYHLSMAT